MRQQKPPTRALSAANRHIRAPYPRDEDAQAQTGITIQRQYMPSSTPPLPMCADWDREVVRHIARHMPKQVRKIRSCASLEALWVPNSRWTDLHCPACAETPGWLDFEALEFCPLCIGFQFLPATVVRWYVFERQAMEAYVTSETLAAHKQKAGTRA